MKVRMWTVGGRELIQKLIPYNVCYALHQRIHHCRGLGTNVQTQNIAHARQCDIKLPMAEHSVFL